jgi:tRNA-binding EMAP/Myf-like protein
VAEIVGQEAHPYSENLHILKVSDGTKVRTICSPRIAFLPYTEMTGLCTIISNMKRQDVEGVESEGHVLIAGLEGKYEILRPGEHSVIGERVFCEDDDMIDINKKEPDVDEAVIREALTVLYTDDDFEAKWCGFYLSSTGGRYTVKSFECGTFI